MEQPTDPHPSAESFEELQSSKLVEIDKREDVVSFRKFSRGLFRQAQGQGARKAATALVVIAVGAVVGVASQILVARIAGAERYGVYAFVLTWLQILALLSRLGLENGLMKFLSAYIATRKFGLARGIARQAYAIVLVASAMVSLLWATGVFLFRGSLESDVANAMWVACLGLPCLALLVVGGGALRGLKKIFEALFPLIVLRRLLFGVFAGLLYLLGRRDISGAEVVAYDVVAIAIGASLSFIWFRRAIPFEVKRSSARLASRVWLKTSIPMGVSSALLSVVNRLDILLIGILLTTSVTGIYAAAARIAGLAIFGLQAVDIVAAPLISENYARGDFKALQRVVTKACWMSTAFTLLFAVLVLSFSDFILGLFGEEFKAASTVLIILFIGKIVLALTGPVGYVLNMTKYEKEAMAINAVNLVAALLGVPMAIQFGGIVGAAIVTAGLIAVVSILRWIVVFRKLGIRSWVFG